MVPVVPCPSGARYAVCKLFIDPDDLNELVRTADRLTAVSMLGVLDMLRNLLMRQVRW